MGNLLTGSGVSSPSFKSLYPIHVFGVSKQSERLTEVVVDLTVRMEFSAAVPANTQAYAPVISDRMLKFKRPVPYSRRDSQLSWSTVGKKYWCEQSQKIRLRSLHQTTALTFKLHSVLHCTYKRIVTMNWQW